MARPKSQRADGRCHDYRTRPPLGCCAECWHEHGAEVRGGEYAYASPRSERVFTLCDAHWVRTVELTGWGLAPLP